MLYELSVIRGHGSLSQSEENRLGRNVVEVGKHRFHKRMRSCPKERVKGIGPIKKQSSVTKEIDWGRNLQNLQSFIKCQTYIISHKC